MRTRSFGNWRLVASLVVGVLVAVTLSVAPTLQQAPAQALSGSDFDPGQIISDGNFYNGSAMSEAEIQRFLENAVGGVCSNSNCLAAYRADTPTRTWSFGTCSTYHGGAGESAARIIFKVQQACNLSAKVILVTLQKEQSLVTNRQPSDGVMRKAMGYGCPDTSSCDSTYYGFFNQIFAAGRQLTWYGNPAGSFTSIKVGQVNAVRYHPNAACGSKDVLIKNRATAALYYYTPYTPNGAALGNLYGVGDACSAYGNRNFWRMYSEWFGSPAGSTAPFGGMDLTAHESGDIQVNGWAIDPDTKDPIDVHLYLNGAGALVTKANASRPDVGRAYPGFGDNHGINARLTAPTGTHQVCAYAIDTPGGASNTLLGCRTISIVSKSPFGGMDASSAAYSGKITVRGWTIDPETKASLGVHIYVDGAFAKSTTANASRPDVARHYPAFGPNHGIDVTFEAEGGTHTVCAYGINVGYGVNTLLGCQTVRVDSMSPFGGMDVKTSHLAATVNGWTIDPEQVGPIDVHVYVDGVPAAVTRAGASRPDVGRVYPAYGPNHGIDVTFAATAGAHTVCAYGINVGRGVNTLLGCQAVTVPNLSPFGGMDARREGGEIIVNGWAIDPDTTGPIDVHVYANGAGAAIGKADYNRPDVGRVYPAFGPNHGINQRFAAPAGAVQVCVYGINVGLGSNTLLGCQTVNP